ncbi:MAG TPA: amidohydrolase family protein, partial [Mycobacterium sp.]|nr:amidohydrolase family protein [Mycobacterium sp.]
FDQSYLKDALAQLGPSFVGVTQIPVDTTDAEILDLDRAGVRAVRFNLYRGGSATLADVDTLARRVHDVAGWHSEFYLDVADLANLEPMLAALPKVSIDHLGMSDDPSGALLRLVGAGMVVKATGFGRIHLDDPDSLMRIIVDANPSALIFGTDLPSTRAATPFDDSDIERVADAVGAEHTEAVLSGNARTLYRLT